MPPTSTPLVDPSSPTAATAATDEVAPPVFQAPPRQRRGRRRAIVIATVLVLVAGGGGTAWWLRGRDGGDDDTATAAATTVQQLAEVTAGTISSSVSAESTVQAAETESLSFASAGAVTEVLVEVGDTVAAGQVLARLDSASLEADVADAEASIAQLEATLADERTSLWEYREDNADEDDTYDDGDLLEDQIASAAARLSVAQDTLAGAQEALDGAVLTASIDGTVTTMDLTTGEQLGSSGAGGTTLTGSATGSGNSAAVIDSGSAVAGVGATGTSGSSAQIEIVSTGRFQLDLALDSTEVGVVAVGQEVTISESTSTTTTTGFPGFPGGGNFPGFPGQAQPGPTQSDQSSDGQTAPQVADDAPTVTGTVTEVSDTADASSGVATYAVTVEFTDDTDQFFVGTTVVAEIITESRSALLVPQQAVVTRDDLPTVVVALDGTVDGRTETREVATGGRTGNQIEITAGVSAGEQVIVEITVPGGGGFPGGGAPPFGSLPGGDAGQNPTQGSGG